MNYIKPEIGAKPHWIVLQDRISELADAINRNCGDHKNNEHGMNMICAWANEICVLCRAYNEIGDYTKMIFEGVKNE